MSCTEQGRWTYASRSSRESEVVAERQVRYAMKDSVNASLRAAPGTARTRAACGTRSSAAARAARHALADLAPCATPTRRARRDLDTVLAAFPLQDGQQGMLVLHGARVVGLDLVSRAPQYAELHDKLLRSYAFEALVRDGEPGDRAVADAFLERIADLPGRRYKSPGLGWDVRFEGGGVLGLRPHVPRPRRARRVLRRRRRRAAPAAADRGGQRERPRAGLAHRRRARARPPAAGALTRRGTGPRRDEGGGIMEKDARDRAYKAAAHITREQLRRDAPERARVLDAGRAERRGRRRGHLRPRRVGARARSTCRTPSSSRRERRAPGAAPRAAAHRQLPGRGLGRGVSRIRAFVEAGGSLFTTDWALKHVIEPAFPGVLAFNGRPTPDDVVRIEVRDPDNIYLQGVLDGQDDPQWWLEALVVPHHASWTRSACRCSSPAASWARSTARRRWRCGSAGARATSST